MNCDCAKESVDPYASSTNTQSCLIKTRRCNRFISIADGRTRIWGSREESIFLRSRGSSPYYASMSAGSSEKDGKGIQGEV